MESIKVELSTLRGGLVQRNSGYAIPTNAFAEIVSRVEPTIVRIDVTGENFQAMGSGFLVDNSGYVVTNQHVIKINGDVCTPYECPVV